MPTLMIVVGSTRPGRAAPYVAGWFAAIAREHGGFDLDVADLAEVGLPLLDEPGHPRLREYRHAHTRAWSARVDAADAFVFVTPEYNHGLPAAVKNAVDYLHWEWRHKPVGVVSYGGASGGTRAATHLRAVLGGLGMASVAALVAIPFFAQHLDRDAGTFAPGDVQHVAARGMLDELATLAPALAGVRAAG